MHLQELNEKDSDVDLLKEMLSFFVNRMMELDVGSLAGAVYGERRIDRINQRNDYRELAQARCRKVRVWLWFASTNGKITRTRTNLPLLLILN